MDGVSLGHLVPGLTYEVGQSLGTWLISRGIAEELAHESQALVIPLDNPRAFEQLTRGVSVVPPPAIAAEKAEKPKTEKKPRRRRKPR